MNRAAETPSRERKVKRQQVDKGAGLRRKGADPSSIFPVRGSNFLDLLVNVSWGESEQEAGRGFLRHGAIGEGRKSV